MPELVVAVASISIALVFVAIVIAVVRLVRGPFLVDRALVLDLISFLLMALCGAYAAKDNSSAMLDVAILVAIAGTLGTFAFARHIESEAER